MSQQKQPNWTYYYICDGKVYNLKEFIPIHPGGSLWLNHSYGRDVTTLIHSYHRDPSLCKKILAKYEVDIKPREAINRTFNVPDFIIPPDFDAARDVMTFDWSKKDSIFEKTKREINKPDF